MQTNRDLYGTAEFGDWSTYTNFETYEAFLVQKYFDPSKKTLEAGTGGGRIILGLRQMGFEDLFAFDFIPHFVSEVRGHDPAGQIRVSAQDATQLGFETGTFDQVLYLAQIISFMDVSGGRDRAMKEACRVLKPGGVALFSFLSYEVRFGSQLYRLFSTYLGVLRSLTRSNRSMQNLPWLRKGGRFNRAALLDRGPYVYWYRAPEAVADLCRAGFKVQAVASLKQLEDGRMVNSVDELLREPLTGHFYCVCTK